MNAIMNTQLYEMPRVKLQDDFLDLRALTVGVGWQS